MKSNSKTIKFFISSTFKDFKKERNVLQKFVFPKLKKICQEKGFSFQPVDLRWGVTQEVSEDNQTLQYCLNEVSRCSHEPKPNLLILLGQRYGWGPLPQSITVEQWKYLKNKIDSDSFQYIEEWYIQDKNDCGEKYFLKDKKALTKEGWSKKEKTLQNILQNSTKDKEENPIKGYEYFHTSATEKEIRYALNKQYEANSSNTFIFTREFSAGKDKDLIEESQKAQAKLENLKHYLQEIEVTNLEEKKITVSNYKSYDEEYETLEDLPEYLKKFHDDIYKEFKEKIETEMNFFEKRSNLKQGDLTIELEQQQKFLEMRSKIVLGRDDEISEIKNFVLNSDKQYYLLYGESGSGKSSVMAKTISELVDKDRTSLVLGHKFVYRFIGTTAHTSSPRDTYEYIFWQIKGTKERPSDIEHEDYKFYAQFREALEEYTKDEELTIFIDAVDQFSIYDSLSIFLDKLPKNVKVVFSTLFNDKREDEEYANYFNRLCSIVKEPKKLEIQSSNNEEILQAWLTERKRKLTDNQQKTIINSAKNKIPLYLRLAFIISLEWKSIDEISKDALGETAQELIIKYFDNVINKHYIKRELLELVLGFISASKDGLSESELIDLLSREKEVLTLYEREKSSYPNLTRFPDFLFSKLYYHIQEVFTEKLMAGEMLISPFHGIIGKTIKKFSKENLHHKLLSYYRESSFDLMVQNPEPKIKLKNFLFHLSAVKDTEKLQILVIMFQNEIDILYSNDFDSLAQLYDFESNTPEVKKIQGMKFILNSCFIQTDDNKYKKLDYKKIDISTERLNEYGISNFAETLKKMINQTGVSKFDLSSKENKTLDDLLWLNDYSIKDNYTQLYIALVGENYMDFSLEISKDRVCKECSNIRQEKQLVDGCCIKCSYYNEIFSDSLIEYLKSEKFFIDNEEFLEYYRSEYDEWISEQEDQLQDCWKYDNEIRKADADSPIPYAEFMDAYSDEFDIDIARYLSQELEMHELDKDTLAELGFKDA